MQREFFWMHKTRHICHESLRMCFVIVVNAPWFTSFHVAAAPVVPLTNSINQSSEVPITLCISRFTSFFFFYILSSVTQSGKKRGVRVQINVCVQMKEKERRSTVFRKMKHEWADAWKFYLCASGGILVLCSFLPLKITAATLIIFNMINVMFLFNHKLSTPVLPTLAVAKTQKGFLM